MHAELEDAAREVADRRGLKLALDRIWVKDPVVFDPKIVAAIEAANDRLGYPGRRITSGPGTTRATSPW
jgi:N-carbamoyl-L-amino-acid hydrolase